MNTCKKYKKSQFISDITSGTLSLIGIRKESLRGIIVGKNRLSSMPITHKFDKGTKINGSERTGRDLIFYDCRGERYDIFLYNPRFKSDIFIVGDFILVVNFDKVEFSSKLFFFRKKFIDKGNSKNKISS